MEQPTQSTDDESSHGDVFDAQFLRRLEQIELLARRIFRGQIRGERITKRRGRGLEFTDFRPYQTGDDLRYLDWNVSARLDKLFLKLFASEEDLSLHVLLDVSASMSVGRPEKFDYARRLAAAFAYIGVANLDRVTVSGFDASCLRSAAVFSSRRHMVRVFDTLRNLTPRGVSSFSQSMESFCAMGRSRGLVVVLSDLLTESEKGGRDIIRGLDALRHRGHEVAVVQVLSEEDIQPPLDGALELVDAETREVIRLSADDALRQAYARALSQYLDLLEHQTKARGVHYLRTSTAISFEDVMLKYLRYGAAFS